MKPPEHQQVMNIRMIKTTGMGQKMLNAGEDYTVPEVNGRRMIVNRRAEPIDCCPPEDAPKAKKPVTSAAVTASDKIDKD